MQQGFLKVAMLEFESEQFTSARQYFIRLTCDDATYTYSSSQLQQSENDQTEHGIKMGQPKYHLFPIAEHLQVRVFENEQTDTRYGYFKIPLGKLYDMPHKNHIINTKCVWFEKQDKKVNEEMLVSAIIKLSVVYYDNACATLLIRAQEAQIQRQIQTIGQIDSYLQCKIGDVSSSTEVCQGDKDNGKNPKWNQVLSFLLQSIPSSITFQVRDKDMVNDEIIGSKTLNPQQQYILIQTKQEKERQVIIQFAGKRAGVIKLTTFLTLSSNKNQQQPHPQTNLK